MIGEPECEAFVSWEGVATCSGLHNWRIPSALRPEGQTTSCRRLFELHPNSTHILLLCSPYTWHNPRITIWKANSRSCSINNVVKNEHPIPRRLYLRVTRKRNWGAAHVESRCRRLRIKKRDYVSLMQGGMSCSIFNWSGHLGPLWQRSCCYYARPRN